MELHGIFFAFLSLTIYSTHVTSLAVKAIPQHQPSLILSTANTTHLNSSNELTIAENVAQLLAALARTPEREYRKATLFNVQVSVDRTYRASNQISDFRSIACWFRSGAPHPVIPLYNAFIMHNGAPRYWDRWRSPEPFWVGENWGSFDWAEAQGLMTFEDADRKLKEKVQSRGYSKVVIGGWDLARTPLSYCFVGVILGSGQVVNIDVMVWSGLVRQVERCENET